MKVLRLQSTTSKRTDTTGTSDFEVRTHSPLLQEKVNSSSEYWAASIRTNCAKKYEKRICRHLCDRIRHKKGELLFIEPSLRDKQKIWKFILIVLLVIE